MCQPVYDMCQSRWEQNAEYQGRLVEHAVAGQPHYAADGNLGELPQVVLPSTFDSIKRLHGAGFPPDLTIMTAQQHRERHV